MKYDFEKFWMRSGDVYRFKNLFYASKEEYDRFCATNKFPIKTTLGTLYWSNENGERHNLYGPAVTFYESDDESEWFCYYYLNGVRYYTKEEWEKQTLKKVIFSAQKIKTLKRLLYIPELYENIYYEHKSHFISLLSKI